MDLHYNASGLSYIFLGFGWSHKKGKEAAIINIDLV